MKSTSTQYGTIAITIHWLTAILIVGLLASGNYMHDLADPEKAFVLRMHAPIGIAVLLITLFRIYWWWRKDTKPAPTGDDAKWQEFLAKLIHVAFYLVLIVMGASGIGMFVLSGAPAIIFGDAGGALPNFHDYPPHIPHFFGSRILVGLIVLHAGAALFHQFVKKDGLISRMWYK